MMHCDRVSSREFTREHRYLEAREWEFSLSVITASTDLTCQDWPGDSPEFQYGVEANVAMFLVSPALGAMFAPLVLKSVLTPSLFRWLTSLCRTPVQTIRFNTTSTTTTTSSKPSHAHHGVSRIVRAIIGGVAALVLLAAGIVTFLWYRRRYNIHISSHHIQALLWSRSQIQG